MLASRSGPQTGSYLASLFLKKMDSRYLGWEKAPSHFWKHLKAAKASPLSSPDVLSAHER